MVTDDRKSRISHGSTARYLDSWDNTQWCEGDEKGQTVNEDISDNGDDDNYDDYNDDISDNDDADDDNSQTVTLSVCTSAEIANKKGDGF